MRIYGETHGRTVASMGDFVAALILAVSRGVMRGVEAVEMLGRRIGQRRVLAELAACDDRMLRDIGLTRADLRDAAATPFPADPTRVLVLRATERQVAARLALREIRRRPA